MTNTVTLLGDHKGFARPSVLGDEYVVDAVINVTDMNDSQAGLTGQLDGTANTLLVSAGTFDSAPYQVGQNIIIAGSSHEDGLVTLVDKAGALLTLSAVSENEVDDTGMTISTDQEVIPYSTFGLRTVTQVQILGQEDALLNWSVELDANGNSKIADKLVLRCITCSTGALKADDAGTIRVRLYGLL